MINNNCIFCKIASEEFDSAKIWEDNDFLAFLDINPNTEGMTLIIPKKHYNSNVFEIDDDELAKFIKASKKVAKIIENYYKVKRVAMVIEGMGVNHAHIKLYPLHGLEEEFKEIESKEKVFFSEYQGYLTTQLGPKKDLEELKKTSEKIRNSII